MNQPQADLFVRFPDCYPELYDSMGQVAARVLHDLGLPPAEAKAGALVMMEAIRKEVGGMMMYLPKGQDYDLSVRDQEIFGKFTGRNYHLLASEYGLSEMQVRTIVNRGRAALRAKLQRPLF